jgi:hypothetical protein
MRVAIAECGLQRYVRSGHLLICALLLWLATSNQASAVSVCVSTAAELQEALNNASDGGMYSGDGVEINLVQGTYTTGAPTANGPFLYQSTAATGDIILSGGWDSQCSGFSNNAALTILDGNGATQVLSIDNANASVSVTTLTIQNGQTDAYGGGLAINTKTAAPDSGSVYVAFNIIQNNKSTDTAGGVAIIVSGSASLASLQTNVITGNSAPYQSAGFVQGNYPGIAGAYITGNTVYGNTATAFDAWGGLSCCGYMATDPAIYANIFWQNTKYGLDVFGTAGDLEYNDYGILGGVTPDHDIGNTSINPKFVDAANGDFHLSGTSPLLAYTSTISLQNATTSMDVSGNAYPKTGKIDLGAYAETIFTDGFDIE